MRLSAHVTLLLLVAAPPLAAQQSAPLFPKSIEYVAPEPTRFQVISREIDSASAIGGQMQIAAAAREETARRTGQLVFISQVARGLGSRGTVGTDWVSAVTAAGIMQLGSSSGLFGPLRGPGQLAGLSAITGGASWLLSSLTRYSPRFGATRIRHTH